MRIIWKGFAAISINKDWRLAASPFNLWNSDRCNGSEFSFQCSLYLGYLSPLFVLQIYDLFLTLPNNNALIFKYLQLYTPATQQNTRIEHDYIASDSLGKKFAEKRQNTCKCLKYVLYLRCD